MVQNHAQTNNVMDRVKSWRPRIRSRGESTALTRKTPPLLQCTRTEGQLENTEGSPLQQLRTSTPDPTQQEWYNQDSTARCHNHTAMARLLSRSQCYRKSVGHSGSLYTSQRLSCTQCGRFECSIASGVAPDTSAGDTETYTQHVKKGQSSDQCSWIIHTLLILKGLIFPLKTVSFR